MYCGHPLTALARDFLKQKSYSLLYQLAAGEISYETLVANAGPAQQARDAAMVAKRQATEAERESLEARRLALEAEWQAQHRRDLHAIRAAQEARKLDPSYIAEMRAQELWRKYGVEQVSPALLPRMNEVLARIDSGDRLKEEDLFWLSTKARAHYSRELQEIYHLREAEYFIGQYSRSHDPWNAVSASGHLRRCDRSPAALDLLDKIPERSLRAPKLRSAVCTTRGGAMRDLGRLAEAIRLGEQAHELRSMDYRPCTLLGAVHMESGNFAEGDAWYGKAIERGANEQGIDHDLRAIFQRADAAKRAALRAFLLADDARRYSWVDEAHFS